MLIMEFDMRENDITSQSSVISHIRSQNETGYLHLHHVFISSSAPSAEGCTTRTRTCQMWRKSLTSGASAWRTNLRAIYTTVNLFSIWREKVLFLSILLLIANDIYCNLTYWGFDSSVGTCTWLQI